MRQLLPSNSDTRPTKIFCMTALSLSRRHGAAPVFKRGVTLSYEPPGKGAPVRANGRREYACCPGAARRATSPAMIFRQALLCALLVLAVPAAGAPDYVLKGIAIDHPYA